MNALAALLGRGWRGPLGFRIGTALALLLLLIGFVSIVWTPYPIERLDVGAAMQGPSAAHWLGTDNLGRDLVSMLMKGMLTSFVVAAVAVAIGALIGVPLGLLAAMWGGLFDRLILKAADFFFVFPALVAAILITAIFGPSALGTMLAVGLAMIPAFARTARDGMQKFASLDYLAAGRLAGLTRSESTRRHALPDIASLLFAQALSQLGLGILAEAGLSYVGLGTQAPATSLGLMLKDAQTYLPLEPSLALIPGLVIIAIVVALNLSADGLRELLDPGLKRIGVLRAAD